MLYKENRSGWSNLVESGRIQSNFRVNLFERIWQNILRRSLTQKVMVREILLLKCYVFLSRWTNF